MGSRVGNDLSRGPHNLLSSFFPQILLHSFTPGNASLVWHLQKCLLFLLCVLNHLMSWVLCMSPLHFALVCKSTGDRNPY